MDPVWLWSGFAAGILVLLLLDLGVFQRNPHAVSVKESLGWSAVWIGIALLFNLSLWLFPGFYFGSRTLPEGLSLDAYGGIKAMEFFTGYLVEKALSVDNLFVIALIFTAFGVPAAYQHRVLFYGILGAIVMRVLFIIAGTALLAAFHWVVYVFGLLLVVTGVRMALAHGAPPPDPAQHGFVRLMRRILPVSPGFDGPRFITRTATGWAVTPLLLALLMVEFTDLVFALDSIPAILAITPDPFIVATSNIFAILGLRALFFALAGLLAQFHLLAYALAAILVFVGAKMLLIDVLHVPIAISLGVIAGLLAAGIAASWLRPQPVAGH
jgi:tellurite resistance protein TerC